MRKMILSALILLPTFAFADVKSELGEIRKSYDACTSSPANLEKCALDTYKKSDALLNKAYQEIVASLKMTSKSDPSSVEALRRLKSSQRAWIAFRDTNCSLEGIEMLGGTGEHQIIASCLANTTMDRVGQLDRIFNSEH